jgi:hypothetical protein
VHRPCFLNAFTWDTIIAYKNMYGRINSGKLWSLMGRGCHLGTPSRNVLSMYCFFAISHLNRIIFYSLIIMRNIGGKTIVLILNGCKSCLVSLVGLSWCVICGRELDIFVFCLLVENFQFYEKTFSTSTWSL